MDQYLESLGLFYDLLKLSFLINKDNFIRRNDCPDLSILKNICCNFNMWKIRSKVNVVFK